MEVYLISFQQTYKSKAYSLISWCRAVRIAPFSNRLAQGVPSNIQGLRCLANFEALRFSEPIRMLAEKMVDRMVKNSSQSGGKYVSVHLRFETVLYLFDLLPWKDCGLFYFLLLLYPLSFLSVSFLFSQGYGCIFLLWIWWWGGRETWNGYCSRKKLEGEIQEKRTSNKTGCKSCGWKMSFNAIGGAKLSLPFHLSIYFITNLFWFGFL